ERFLVCDDVAAYLFAELFRISKGIEQVVFELKSDADIYTEVIKSFSVFRRRATEDSAKFKAKTQQHRCLQPDHLNVLGLRYVGEPFELHVPLLTFTHFGSALVEGSDY